MTMKNVIRTTKTLILALSLVFVSGCHTPEIDDKEEIPKGWKSLDEIADNPAYQSLSLTGIRWRLIGFANEEKNIIRPIVASVPYVVYFRIDNLIGGHIYVRDLAGTYFLDGDNLQAYLEIIEEGSEYGMDDADSFIEAMNNVHTYKVTEKGLQLYYGDQQYLLFKCAFDDRCLQVINCAEEDYSEKVCVDESISGTWRAHKTRLNISGALCEVTLPTGSTFYPDISIVIPDPLGNGGNTFYNKIGIVYETFDDNQINITYGDITRRGEDDWGISFKNNLRNTTTYCLSTDELIFFDENGLPLIVFEKK